MAVLGFRVNPNGGTTNAMLDMKYVQTGATNTSGLHYTFNHGGSFLDRFSILSSGNVGIGAIAPDTNLQVVGHVHVGNQTTFENTGGWNKTIYLDGAVHARMRILGSAFASGKNSATETSIWVDNSVAPYSGLDTNAGSFRINAGFTTMLNSARSPIFYDSDNTAYYIDAASTSVINALSVSTLNNINAANGTWHTSSEGKARFYFASNGTTYFRTGNDYVFRNNSDSGVVVIDSSGNLRTTTGGDNSPSYSLHVGGTGFASADFRAPIFYDSNDTTYYTDPAGLTRFNALNIGNQGALTGNTTYALGAYHNARYMVGLRYSSGGANYPWLVHDSWNGSAFIIHFNGVGDRFQFSEGGIGQAHADFRAPIFYDSGNTAYYLDPANSGTSLLVAGNVGIGTTSPAAKFAVNGGTVNTTTYTSSESRIADGSIHLMKTVAGGIFESIRAMNLDTTAGTTVRVLAAATSDPFNNANGGKVFIDAIRTIQVVLLRY